MWHIFLTRTIDHFTNPIFMLRQATDEQVLPGILCESSQYLIILKSCKIIAKCISMMYHIGKLQTCPILSQPNYSCKWWALVTFIATPSNLCNCSFNLCEPCVKLNNLIIMKWTQYTTDGLIWSDTSVYQRLTTEDPTGRTVSNWTKMCSGKFNSMYQGQLHNAYHSMAPQAYFFNFN